MSLCIIHCIALSGNNTFIMLQLKTIVNRLGRFLCTANQTGLLSFSKHFLGGYLTLGLTHTGSYSDHEETHPRNRNTSPHYEMNASNAQIACSTCSTFQWNWRGKNLEIFAGGWHSYFALYVVGLLYVCLVW